MFKEKHICYFSAYVQDNGNPSLHDIATIIINVTDINDNSPVFKDSQLFIEIPENTEQDAIHTFVAHDADIGDNGRVTYTITGMLFLTFLPASHDFCCLLSHLLMFLGRLS